MNRNLIPSEFVIKVVMFSERRINEAMSANLKFCCFKVKILRFDFYFGDFIQKLTGHLFSGLQIESKIGYCSKIRDPISVGRGTTDISVIGYRLK